MDQTIIKIRSCLPILFLTFRHQEIKTKDARASFAGILAWIVFFLISLSSALPAHAAQYWDDTFYQKHWETSADVCQWGEAEARVADLRKTQPSRTWDYSALIVDEYLPGEESRCQFLIEYVSFGIWLPWAQYDILHYRFGQPDYCPRGSLDAATGRCRTKMNGCPTVSNGTNPCDGATGNKYQAETDYTGPEYVALVFQRLYNSLMRDSGPLGAHWRSNYHRTVLHSASYNRATVFRENGRGYTFTLSGSVWITDADVHDKLTQLTSGTNPAGWRYSLTDGSVENYDVAGRLISMTDSAGRVTNLAYDGSGRLATVTGPFGHRLTFSYDGSNRIATMTDPVGGIYTYGYDAINNLTSVTYPDTYVRGYVYENTSLPDVLTGIMDENGNRYATFGYNAQAAASLSAHADGQEQHTLTYVSSTRTDITDAAGNVTSYTFGDQLGVLNMASRSMPADSKTLTQSFDASNNLTCIKDEEGQITTYTYNSSNQRASMTVGQGGTCGAPVATSATRTTTYQYLSTSFDLPTVISSPSVVAGQVKTTTIQYTDAAHPNLPTNITQSGYTPTGTAISRTVVLGYNTAGQITSIDGPRSDVSDITTLAYYICTTGAKCGQLSGLTNALGYVTTFDTYDANGRLTQMTDPNGLRTNYVYDARGRLKTVTQTPPIGGGTTQTTQYVYDAAEQLKQVTFPDGKILTYNYDAAHQLGSIADNLGNLVSYAYDARGNRSQEYTYDPSSTLVRQIDLAYDIRNRLASINAAGSLTQTVYDAVGNLRSEIDPNANPPTQHSPDPLNRLVQTIDRIGGQSTYNYDVNDRLIQAKSPNNATTQYQYDDLGNLLKEISLDRGTITYTYDNAGNVKTVTDARGVLATYTYDALNRVTLIDYPGSDDDVTFRYDIPLSGEPPCPYGRGRLCRALAVGGNQNYGYDAYGNVIDLSHQINSVNYVLHYSYDAGNRVKTITYPSGMLITYGRDAVGRIQSVTRTVGGVTTTLLSNRAYRADGLVRNQTFGNGLAETRLYDLQGRLQNQTVGGDQRAYPLYDANGNVKQIATTVFSGSYAYDPLDRLTQDTPTGAGTVHAFNYDDNGNRTLDNAVSYLYASNTNRLNTLGGVALTYDAAGNIKQDAFGRSYTYNGPGQLANATVNNLTTTYRYNAFGHRTLKARPNLASVYYYPGLNGELLAETDGSGAPITEYVYADQTPIAQLRYAPDPGSATTAPPTVTGFWPGAGVANTTVFVFGSGFVPGIGATTVTVNGINAPIMQVLSPDLLFFLLPAGNTNGPIQITTAQGSATSASAFGTVLSGVQITGLWPAEGQVNTLAFVFGNGFTPGQTVKVNQTPAPIVQVLDQSLFFVMVPPGAATGPIQVTTFQGTATSATPFTVFGTSPPPSTTVTYLHTDHLGTPRAATNQSGQVVWRWESSAFGDTPPNEDPDGDGKKTTINFRHSGGYGDQESGLTLIGERYYDPKTGRWITADRMSVAQHFKRWRGRLGKGGEASPESNPYAYGRNNPLRYTDPTGKVAIADDVIIIGGTVIVAGCLASPGCRGAISNAAKACGDVIDRASDMFSDLIFSRPLPLDVGGEEWGKRNGVGATEGRRRAHEVKRRDPMSGARDNYTVDPDTGNVYDPEGEYVGNLDDDYH